MSEEWCQHFSRAVYGEGENKTNTWAVKIPDGDGLVGCSKILPVRSVPNFCSECGAKRPTPKRKTLAEVLAEAYWSQESPKPSTAKRQAEAAIKWVEEVIDEAEAEIEPGSRASTFKALKARLREGKY